MERGPERATLQNMTPLITIPTTTDMLASVGTASTPLFSSLLPIALLGLGFVVAGVVVVFVVNAIWVGVANLTGHGEDPY